jgi:hypothetical protein
MLVGTQENPRVACALSVLRERFVQIRISADKTDYQLCDFDLIS